MSGSSFAFADRRSALAFWVGSGIVSAGVLLHLPMFWMGRNMGFVLAGMPMDSGMLWGMALIVLGIIAAGFGLMPAAASNGSAHEVIAPPRRRAADRSPLEAHGRAGHRTGH